MIRWVLVRDSSGERDPQAFLCSDLDLEPTAILSRFVFRWRIETTFQEVREHLGVETQRQWSDLAILRTTPVLLGLYFLVTLWAHGLMTAPSTAVRPHPTAWHHKSHPTFSGAIAAGALGADGFFNVPASNRERGNPRSLDETTRGDSAPRSMKCGKSSLGEQI